jgi:hypothetical protein
LFDVKLQTGKAIGFFLIGIVRDNLATTYENDGIDQSLT